MMEVTAEHVEVARNRARAFVKGLPPHVDAEDYEGAALEALVVAARDYDESSPAKFESWVWNSVYWRLMDKVRREAVLSRGAAARRRSGELEVDSRGRPLMTVMEVVSLDAVVEVDADPGALDDVSPVDVKDVLSRLSARDRFVVLACAYGYSQVEVAAMIGLSPGRVSQIAGRLKPLLTGPLTPAKNNGGGERSFRYCSNAPVRAAGALE